MQNSWINHPMECNKCSQLEVQTNLIRKGGCASGGGSADSAARWISLKEGRVVCNYAAQVECKDEKSRLWRFLIYSGSCWWKFPDNYFIVSCSRCLSSRSRCRCKSKLKKMSINIQKYVGWRHQGFLDKVHELLRNWAPAMFLIKDRARRSTEWKKTMTV